MKIGIVNTWLMLVGILLIQGFKINEERINQLENLRYSINSINDYVPFVQKNDPWILTAAMLDAQKIKEIGPKEPNEPKMESFLEQKADFNFVFYPNLWQEDELKALRGSQLGNEISKWSGSNRNETQQAAISFKGDHKQKAAYFKGLRKQLEKFVNSELYVTFVDGDYSVLALNWVASLNRLNIGNYLVITMDPESMKLLQEKDIFFFRGNLQAFGINPPENEFDISINQSKKPKKNFAEIWQFRWMHVLDMLKAGIHVIMSDADVVWLKNPKFLVPNKMDIWASMGTYPSDFYEKWGFTVCNGLLYLSSNDAVISFVEKLLIDIPFFGDDQVTFNNLLESSGLFIQEKNLPSYLTSVAHVIFPRLKIGLVSKEIFERKCSSQTQTKVKDVSKLHAIHCTSTKSIREKYITLKSNDLWFLDSDLFLFVSK